MTKILSLLLFVLAATAVWLKGWSITVLPLEFVLLIASLLLVLCVVAPLVRSRRVHGIGVASLLRRCSRFAMLLTLALTWLAPGAEAATVRFRPWTNVPPVVTTLAASNLNNNEFVLQRGQGVGVQVRVTNPSGTACTNLTIPFNVTGDGTNWTEYVPFQFVSSPAFTATNKIYFTNLTAGDPGRLNNTFKIRPAWISNYGAGTITISNIGWSYNND
ncbi:MAG TPA: hypothetical protein VK530_17760 [Candidatus Acidoferrum sp.]|nr:hypothetical protein [Candidatus Acidoferrum sp.]